MQDILTRDEGLFQLNAGAEGLHIAQDSASEALAAFEMFLRQVLLLPSRPAVDLLCMSPSTDSPLRCRALREYFTMVGEAAPLRAGYENIMSVNGFDHFQAPFAVMKKRPFDDKANRFQSIECAPGACDNDGRPGHFQRCSEDQRANVALCAVDFDKQDGHHSHAADLGFNATRHPKWTDPLFNEKVFARLNSLKMALK